MGRSDAPMISSRAKWIGGVAGTLVVVGALTGVLIVGGEAVARHISVVNPIEGLDGQVAECRGGDAAACDALAQNAAPGTTAWFVGATCAGVVYPGSAESCAGLQTVAGVSAVGVPGADAELDVLMTSCDGGDLPACDELYRLAPLGSVYERFGDTCGNRLPGGMPFYCSSVFDESVEGAYGSDEALDRLWDACRTDDMAACDELWRLVPNDTPAEALGASCNGRATGIGRWCVDVVADVPQLAEWMSIRDTWTELYTLACGAGDFTACDDLSWATPDGSSTKMFASSCGDRLEGSPPGGCAAALGDGEHHQGLVGSDPALDPDALACGTYGGAACDRLATVAPTGTEYDLVAITCGGRRYTPGPQPCPTG